MKYPVSHMQRFQEIEEIIESWPVDKSFDQVLKWLMQFDTDDIDLGVRILKNLNVIGFEDLNTSLSIAYSKLERVAIDKNSKITAKNTLFAGVGEGGKSGAMVGYNFRIANELPEENFMSESSIPFLEQGLIENIVLIDDVIGTGKQAGEDIKKLTEKVTPFGVKNIFLLTATGMAEGIKKITSDTKAHVFSAFEYSEFDTASNLDSPFYDGVPHERRERLKQRLEYYGSVSSTPGLGYGNLGALIAFYYNTPNISLPVIWGSNNSWIPLFKRTVKIHGISSYYKKIDASLNKKKKENPIESANQKELYIFVEGRLEEAFYQYVVSKNSTQKNTIFDKISVVALGGFMSKKLIENIGNLSKHKFFILESDDQIPKGMKDKIRENLGSFSVFQTDPWETYLDFDKLASDERWGKIFKVIESIDNLKSKLTDRIYSADIKRYIITQSSGNTDFFESFLNVEKVKMLQNKLFDRINDIADSAN